MGSVEFYITASGPALEAAYKQAREDATGGTTVATPERSPRNTRSTRPLFGGPLTDTPPLVAPAAGGPTPLGRTSHPDAA